MDDEMTVAVTGVFLRHGVSELWAIVDEIHLSEAVFQVRDSDYERVGADAALWRELAALLPRTKLGLVRYMEFGPVRRLLPRGDGEASS